MSQYQFNSSDKYQKFLSAVVTAYPDANPSDISLAVLSTPTTVDGTTVYQQTVDYCGGGPLELPHFGTFDTPINPQTIIENSHSSTQYDHLSDPIQAHRALINDLEKHYDNA